ncbi:hypothetical protein HNQ08_001567 [Deinococcus humi]|uniref:Uncharacterized protein n=1 Tax=Deinococcus humi TaxID=662880 RepID=A0A7W8JSK1_9DEIO|nr:hypothetical protein [Deinococcus humi]
MLLYGPLYHLMQKSAPLAALREARCLLLTMGVNRFASPSLTGCSAA